MYTISALYQIINLSVLKTSTKVGPFSKPVYMSSKYDCHETSLIFYTFQRCSIHSSGFYSSTLLLHSSKCLFTTAED